MTKYLFLEILLGAAAFAQPSPKNVVKVLPSEPVQVKARETVKVAISVQVDSGFHVNSNKPADPYLIPLKLTWSPGPLESAEVIFPKPELQSYGFSDKPVSVFTGNFEIVTRFKTASSAKPGPNTLTGKLHYQACNERECLTPKTVDVTLPVEIVK